MKLYCNTFVVIKFAEIAQFEQLVRYATSPALSVSFQDPGLVLSRACCLDPDQIGSRPDRIQTRSDPDQIARESACRLPEAKLRKFREVACLRVREHVRFCEQAAPSAIASATASATASAIATAIGIAISIRDRYRDRFRASALGSGVRERDRASPRLRPRATGHPRPRSVTQARPRSVTASGLVREACRPASRRPRDAAGRRSGRPLPRDTGRPLPRLRDRQAVRGRVRERGHAATASLP